MCKCLCCFFQFVIYIFNSDIYIYIFLTIKFIFFLDIILILNLLDIEISTDQIDFNSSESRWIGKVVLIINDSQSESQMLYLPNINYYRNNCKGTTNYHLIDL